MAEIRLRREREWVRSQISEQLTIGGNLIEATDRVTSTEALEECRNAYYSWSSYNATLLETSFEGPITNEYHDSVGAISWGGTPPLHEQVDSLRKDITTKSRRLRSIRDRLDLFDGPSEVRGEVPLAASSPAANAAAAVPERRNAVFLVHGHANGPKLQIALWLERLGLEPVILHEQANGGRTILEKFSEEAGGVAFAIVLATGDDEGRLRGQAELEPRPRQNVVLELGFFLGKLGRGRVVVLLEPDVALPSDYNGVVYIDLDTNEGWKLKLAQELVAAGIAIDKTKLVGA